VSRPTTAQLDAMSHAEFKRRYMEPVHITLESAQARDPLPPIDDEYTRNPVKSFDLSYIRTWEI